MASMLPFNACHNRCVCRRMGLFDMKRPFTNAPIDSRSQTLQRPARRTLQVQHSVRRLTSHPHHLQQGAQYRHTRTPAAVCSSSTGVLVAQASLGSSCPEMLEHLLLYADWMHACNLQGMPTVSVITLTTHHSSRASSLMRVDPTLAGLLKNCRNSGMKS